jgi:hypothetical protein
MARTRQITPTYLARVGMDFLRAVFLAKEMCVFQTDCAGTVINPILLEALVPTRPGIQRPALPGVLQVCVKGILHYIHI